ncbi:MAG: MG2 domain-containing protein [Candidatus Bathyarchaeia archaeon]
MKVKTFASLLLVLLLSSFFTSIYTNLIVNAQIEEQLKASVYTDKQAYQTNEDVIITGRVTFANGTAVKGASVSLEVKNPRNSTIFLDIVYTQDNGVYYSTFKLSSNELPGLYKVYITAYKPGCLSAQNTTTFQVSAFKIAIVGYDVSLKSGNMVDAEINVTLHSNTISSLTVGVCFMLTSPTGKLVYSKRENHVVNNNTIISVDFTFILPIAEPGVYSYIFYLMDQNFQDLFETTGWQIAFTYIPPPIATYGMQLSSNSSAYAIINKSINMFESIECNFNLTESSTWLMIFLESDSTTRVIAAINNTIINQQNLLSQRTLESAIPFLVPPPLNNLIPLILQRCLPTWVLFNVPKGYYKLSFATTTDLFIKSLCIISGPRITSPSIKIIKIIPSSNTVSPEGIMNYNVYVAWNITMSDSVRVKVKLNGNVLTEKILDAKILEINAANMYLSITAPTNIGDYTIYFEAKLEKANFINYATETLHVRSQNYNITVAGEIKYWSTRTVWSILGPREQQEWFESQDKLSALYITDLKIVGVTEWYNNGKPKTVEVSFNATNKVSGEIAENFKFGEGVHYEVAVKPHGSYSAVVKVLLAGDSEIVKTRIPLTDDGKLCFDIIYSKWLIGAIIELSAAVIKPVIEIITSGVTGIIAGTAIDIAKLTVLYLGKYVIDYMNGYFTSDSIVTFLLDVGLTITEAELEKIDELECSCSNPYFVIWSFIINCYHEGKINLLTLINAIFRLGVTLIVKVLPNLKDIIIEVLEKYVSKKFKFSLTGDIINKVKDKVEKNFETISKAFSAILSIGECIVTFWRYFTSPSNEGKKISDAEVDQGPRVNVDPYVSFYFLGSITNLNLTWLKDFQNIEVNINETKAETFLEVDPRLTSVYLTILSDEQFQRRLLNELGFNASETELDWQEETNIFKLVGSGFIYPNLHEMNIKINQTYIYGFQKMSLYPIQTQQTLWLNFSLNYPFTKNLNYQIKVELPIRSKIIGVYSDANFTIQSSSLIIWNSTPNWISINFASYENDTTPPKIHNIIQIPEGAIQPYQPVLICVNVTDDESGVKNVTLYYKIGDSEGWQEKQMILNETTNFFEATIPGQPPDTIVIYKVTVFDYADNEYTDDNAGMFYTITIIPEFTQHTLLMTLTLLTTLTVIIAKNRKKSKFNFKP